MLQRFETSSEQMASIHSTAEHVLPHSHRWVVPAWSGVNLQVT
jgi:hypothetical protein